MTDESAVKTTTLDEAWAEAEAALPEGTSLYLDRNELGEYTAEAERNNHLQGTSWVGGFSIHRVRTTPAEALRDLAAALRERGL